MKLLGILAVAGLLTCGLTACADEYGPGDYGYGPYYQNHDRDYDRDRAWHDGYSRGYDDGSWPYRDHDPR